MSLVRIWFLTALGLKFFTHRSSKVIATYRYNLLHQVQVYVYKDCSSVCMICEDEKVTKHL